MLAGQTGTQHNLAITFSVPLKCKGSLNATHRFHSQQICINVLVIQRFGLLLASGGRRRFLIVEDLDGKKISRFLEILGRDGIVAVMPRMQQIQMDV